MNTQIIRYASPAAIPTSPPPKPSYWLDTGLQITARGPGGETLFHIDRPCALIGSSAGCDVVLPKLPEKAIYLHATSEGVYYVDLSAESGNGEARHGWLEDEVVVGSYRVSATQTEIEVSPPSDHPDLLAAKSLAGPRPVIELSDDADHQARIQLSRILTILGRSLPSGLRVKNALVSAVHAALFVDQDRLWVIDLASLNGLRAGGSRVKVASLRPGESISIGGPMLTFNRLTTAAKPGPPPPVESTPELDTAVSFEPDSSEPDSFTVRDTDPAPANPVPDTSANPIALDENPTELIDPSLGRLMLRENTRQKRRRLVLGGIAVAAMIALGTTGFWAWRQYIADNPIVQEQDPEVQPPPGNAPPSLENDELFSH